MTSMKSLKNDQIFSIKDCISSCNKYKTQIRIIHNIYFTKTGKAYQFKFTFFNRHEKQPH